MKAASALRRARLPENLPRRALRALYLLATFRLPRKLREMRAARQSADARPPRERFLEILPKHAVGAEIGVFKGEFSRHILEIAKPREFHLIDVWWTEFGDTYPDWGGYTDYGRLKTRDAHARAQAATAPFRASTDIVFHVEDGVACLERFPDHTFDWLYIDSSHSYEGTRRELDVAGRKVKPSGLITGHDWQPDPGHMHHGVYKAIQEFVATHPWEVAHVDRCYPAQWCLKRRA